MSGTMAASAEGAEAMFWNPAGLAGLEPESPSDLSVSYDNLLESSYAGSAAFARPLGQDAVIGGGLVYFSQASQTSYNSRGDITGEFKPSDLALSFSYARRMIGLLFGGSLKLIRQSLADVSATSAAIDLGVQAKHVASAGDGAVDVGGSLTNLGPALKLGGVSSPLPLAVVGGVLWHTSPIVSSAFDIHLPVDQAPYISFGLEANLKFGEKDKNQGALRLGFDQNRARGLETMAGLSAGAGLDLSAFRVDYAWVPFGELGMTNRITLGFRF